MNLVKIYENVDNINVELVTGILKNNGIHFIKKQEGSGSYLNVYMGTSLQNKTIWVKKEDVSKALGLIQELFEKEETENEELKEEDIQQINYYSRIKKVFGICFILIPILILIIMIVVTQWKS